uniref:Uncharacterized protein n=1 Tax=Salix viminalis TaxID=40686 RepID=A0A6N2N3K1_SALVM
MAALYFSLTGPAERLSRWMAPFNIDFISKSVKCFTSSAVLEQFLQAGDKTGYILSLEWRKGFS